MIEELLSLRLVAVERLSWNPRSKLLAREGPVHLEFDDGRGLVLEGSTDWTLDLRFTTPGEDSWLNIYEYEFGDGRWVLRDAAAEPPFSDAMGRTLTDWEPVYNDVHEVVGLRLWFDGREVPLMVREGEVTT